MNLGRVVDEQVDVVLFAVELFQLGFEVDADLSHDLFGAVSMASVNASRRYLVTKSKWTWRLATT
ncbi:hypothetical protein GCM10011579_018920 [Streptomyces albiflavescens]|uniref:Uncharacterized protein n=1 Tax=Streptomyces albiflavescens TaxID=1623582 RepID=A0A917XWG4_9ACTN|nr:hypothetical protein GCM10011579_018920 [Streptomyces albiflavescens]